MIRLMHPDTGNIITVTKRQEPFYRRAGWVDPPASSRSASKRTTAAAAAVSAAAAGASPTKPAQHTTATQEKPTA